MPIAKTLNSAVGLESGVAMPRVIAANRVMTFWRTMIGKKIVMAVTGVVLILFVIGHMLSNAPDPGNTASYVRADAVRRLIRCTAPSVIAAVSPAGYRGCLETCRP
jgi:hypothetical protein